MNTDINTLKELMKKEIIHFEYVKKDGTIREANGTTNSEIIQSMTEPVEISQAKTSKQRNISDLNTRYFDTDKKAWRSFVNSSFRSFTIDD